MSESRLTVAPTGATSHTVLLQVPLENTLKWEMFDVFQCIKVFSVVAGEGEDEPLSPSSLLSPPFPTCLLLFFPGVF